MEPGGADLSPRRAAELADRLLPAFEFLGDVLGSEKGQNPTDDGSAGQRVGAQRFDDLGRPLHPLLIVRDDFHDLLVG